MKSKYDFLKEIAKVFIVDSSDIADPFMCIILAFFTHGEGKRSVDVGEYNFLCWILVVFLSLLDHHLTAIYKYRISICSLISKQIMQMKFKSS